MTFGQSMNQTSASAPATTPPVPSLNEKPSWFKRYIANPGLLRITGGFILLLLVLLSAGSAIIFFTAAQFQSRIAELNLNGVPVTIWRIQAFQAQFERWTKDIENLRNGIEQRQFELVA